MLNDEERERIYWHAYLPEHLPDYVADIKKVLAKLGLDSVFYAHIATGEIHFRPLINFKDPKGKRITLTSGDQFTVASSAELMHELEDLCGTGAIRIKT